LQRIDHPRHRISIPVQRGESWEGRTAISPTLITSLLTPINPGSGSGRERDWGRQGWDPSFPQGSSPHSPAHPFDQQEKRFGEDRAAWSPLEGHHLPSQAATLWPDPWRIGRHPPFASRRPQKRTQRLQRAGGHLAPGDWISGLYRTAAQLVVPADGGSPHGRPSGGIGPVHPTAERRHVGRS